MKDFPNFMNFTLILFKKGAPTGKTRGEKDKCGERDCVPLLFFKT